MKRIFQRPVLAGAIVMAAILASFSPTTSSQLSAQVTGYYNPYGQGPYGSYGPGYGAWSRTNRTMFPHQGGVFGGRSDTYSGYGNGPSGYGNPIEFGLNPPIRSYGRSSYYQPFYGPVYVPFGYRDY